MNIGIPRDTMNLLRRGVEALERLADATERQADQTTAEKLERAAARRMERDGTKPRPRSRLSDPADRWDDEASCSRPAHDDVLGTGMDLTEGGTR